MSGNGIIKVTDRIVGSNGADTLRGEAGVDILVGRRGDDRLHGGPGNDLLHGGPGRDLLRGGAGDDAFIFGPSAFSNRPDVIADFERGDVISLQKIDARPASRGDDAFRFIGDDDFGGRSGELRYADGRLSGDLDGDGLADFAIRLRGHPDLHAADLFL